MKRQVAFIILIMVGLLAFSQSIESNISVKLKNDNDNYIEVIYDEKDYLSSIPFIKIQVSGEICAVSLYNENEGDEKIIFNTDEEYLNVGYNRISIVNDKLENILFHTEKENIAVYNLNLQKTTYKVAMIKNIITVFNDTFKLINERGLLIAGGFTGALDLIKNEYVLVINNSDKNYFPIISFKNGNKIGKYYDDIGFEHNYDYSFFVNIENNKFKIFKINTIINGLKVLIGYNVDNIKKCIKEEIKYMEIIPISIEY